MKRNFKKGEEMFCVNCGNEIDENLSRCDFCGAKIEKIKIKDENIMIETSTTEIHPIDNEYICGNNTITENMEKSKKIDKLVWHHIFCIGTCVFSMPSLQSVLTAIMSKEFVAAIVSVILSLWSMYKIIMAICLLSKKKVGITLINIYSWLQIISSTLCILISIGLCTIGLPFMTDDIVRGVVIVVSIFLGIYCLFSLGFSIFNFMYYKKHKNLFIK